jgi:hypothetical protein
MLTHLPNWSYPCIAMLALQAGHTASLPTLTTAPWSAATAHLAQPQWRLSDRPLLRLGTTDGGPQEFSMVTSVLRLPSGEVVVALMGQAELRVFGPDGQQLRTMGRKGRGPGEFPVLWQAFRVGDEIHGLDNAGIVQVFGFDGRYRRTIPRISVEGQRLQRLGTFRDGSVLGTFYPDPLAKVPSGRTQYLAQVVRVRGDSQVRHARMPAGVLSRRGEEEPMALAFGPRLHAAVFDAHYCLGYSERFEIRCHDLSGRVITEIKRPGQAAARITDQDRHRYFAGMDKANPDPRAADFRKQIRIVTQFADFRPAFGRLVASQSGELWVSPFDPSDAIAGTLNPSPDEALAWSVFSREGRWLADVRLPERFRLMDAGRDWIAGIERDADEVEQVVVYGLVR